MNVYPAAGDHSQQLEISGNFPGVSPDGKTLAFVRDHEIRLLPVRLDGRPAGAPSTLVRESSQIASPIWVPNGKEILYLLVDDRSRIRRVEARPGSIPLDAGRIDGEFASLAMSSGGELLAAVEVHDDSYWRIDVRASNAHPEKLRQLAWNVSQLKIAPDEKTLASAISERGASGVYFSQLDGSDSRRLLQIMYKKIEQLDWSPDGQQIVFTAQPGFSRDEPSHLFVASTADSSPKRLLKEFDTIYQATWSRDGKSLYYVLVGSDGGSSVRKVKLAEHQVTKITQGSAQQLQESTDARFLYMLRSPSELLRVSVRGGAPEHVTSGVLQFAVGANELYFERQDSEPPSAKGLNLYRIDLTTRTSRLIANIGFVASAMQLSPDGRFIYFERHNPPKEHIMLVRGWH